MELEVSWALVALLSGAAFCSGLINALAGGGGMMLVPVMLLSGIPPINALALNKFQNTGANFISSLHYVRSGFVDLKSSALVCLSTAVFAIVGVLLLEMAADSGALSTLVPYLLIGVSLYMAYGLFDSRRSKLADKTKQTTNAASGAKGPKRLLNIVIGGLAGLYGGFFGPGTGPILVAMFCALRQYDLKTAITNSKPVLLVMNVVSLILLIFGGHVWWWVGTCMIAGGILGSYVGSRLMISANVLFLRLLLIAVPLLSGLKILFW